MIKIAVCLIISQFLLALTNFIANGISRSMQIRVHIISNTYLLLLKIIFSSIIVLCILGLILAMSAVDKAKITSMIIDNIAIFVPFISM
ncbi:MAG TPA: hypothetical protein IAD11_01360 [Candidatus Stercorousia faecigallinarum]|nr:hypothetical protein [Candidatus Stercorousia faecigallinarum]